MCARAAADALQPPPDPELSRIVEAWPTLPAAIRAAIAALVRARQAHPNFPVSGLPGYLTSPVRPAAPERTEIEAGSDAVDVDDAFNSVERTPPEIQTRVKE